MESSKPETISETEQLIQSETEEETRPDYYEHYQPDWKLTIYTTGDQYEEVDIKNEDFTSELKNWVLKQEENLKDFVESRSKDMCQRSLHKVQKKCVDLKLHVSSKNNEGKEEEDSKAKQIVYYTIFQTYLRKRIRLLNKVLIRNGFLNK